jgi:hypothetical protein
MNEGQWLKDNLCTPSDDEKEMKAPDNDCELWYHL